MTNTNTNTNTNEAVAQTTAHPDAFAKYLGCFEDRESAIAFEERVLAVGPEHLPHHATAVLDGGADTPEYWEWLTAQYLAS